LTETRSGQISGSGVDRFEKIILGILGLDNIGGVSPAATDKVPVLPAG